MFKVKSAGSPRHSSAKRYSFRTTWRAIVIQRFEVRDSGRGRALLPLQVIMQPCVAASPSALASLSSQTF